MMSNTHSCTNSLYELLLKGVLDIFSGFDFEQR